MERVWISIGSNLFDPWKQVQMALDAVVNIPDTRFIACSSYYCSYPLKNKSQPNFLNVVVIIDTLLVPEKLLDCLQYIENQQGRLRTHDRWASRTLDMDILLFGNQCICSHRLIVPHYDMFNREFVLYPLFELVPGYCFMNGRYLSEYLKILPKNGLKFWIE